MGQGYRVILGDKKGKNISVYEPVILLPDKKIWRDFMQCFMDSYLPLAISRKLTKKSYRVIWVGENATSLSEPMREGSYREKVAHNISAGASIPSYEEAWKKDTVPPSRLKLNGGVDWFSYYLVNREKKRFIDMSKYIRKNVYQEGLVLACINPLPLLTAVGNELHYAEYAGPDERLIGSWAWNVISLTKEKPGGCIEILPLFRGK